MPLLLPLLHLHSRSHRYIRLAHTHFKKNGFFAYSFWVCFVCASVSVSLCDGMCQIPQSMSTHWQAVQHSTTQNRLRDKCFIKLLSRKRISFLRSMHKNQSQFNFKTIWSVVIYVRVPCLSLLYLFKCLTFRQNECSTLRHGMRTSNEESMLDVKQQCKIATWSNVSLVKFNAKGHNIMFICW